MLPFSPRLRIALATAEQIARSEQRYGVTCTDLLSGIASLDGGVADSLLKRSGFSSSMPPLSLNSLDHEIVPYAAESLRALSAAAAEAANQSRQLVGVEDLLVGILSPPCAEVARLLAEKKISVEELVSEVRNAM